MCGCKTSWEEIMVCTQYMLFEELDQAFSYSLCCLAGSVLLWTSHWAL